MPEELCYSMPQVAELQKFQLQDGKCAACSKLLMEEADLHAEPGQPTAMRMLPE